MQPTIPTDLWHRDHWTTLAYAFTTLADGGRLDPQRLRLDGDRYPTRVRGRAGTVAGHTDLDCLADMEAAGVLANVGSGLHPVVRFTDQGLILGQWLCGAMDAHTVRTAELTWVYAIAASGARLGDKAHPATPPGRTGDDPIPLLAIADLILRFGRVDRATFHPDGIRAESDTDHTVMLAVLACEIARSLEFSGVIAYGSLSTSRLAELAIVHDLVEAHAGDTNTLGGLSTEAKADKSARERAALEQIRSLGATWISDTIDAYERQACPESRFLRYLDKALPKLTHALNGCVAIRREGRDLDWLTGRHQRQGAELAELYPEWRDSLGAIFHAACVASETALREAIDPTF